MNKNIVLEVIKEILLEAKEGLLMKKEILEPRTPLLSNQAYERKPITYQTPPCLKKHRKK